MMLVLPPPVGAVGAAGALWAWSRVLRPALRSAASLASALTAGAARGRHEPWPEQCESEEHVTYGEEG